MLCALRYFLDIDLSFYSKLTNFLLTLIDFEKSFYFNNSFAFLGIYDIGLFSEPGIILFLFQFIYISYDQF